MRIDLTTFASLAILTATPAFAAGDTPKAAPAAKTAPVAAPVAAPAAKADDKAAPTDFSGQVQISLDDLSKKVVAKTAKKEDYKKVADLVKDKSKDLAADNPHAAVMSERLIERINELESLAQLAALDILRAKDMAIDMELESALARLRAGKAGKEGYARAAAALERRAAAAKEYNPEADAIVARLSAAIADLQKKAATAPPKAEEFAPAMELVTEIRLSNAVAALDKKAIAKQTIMIDIDDVATSWDDHVKAMVTADPSTAEIGKKLAAKLDELRKEAKAGEVKPADVAALRNLLITRAREAATPKK